MAKSILTPETTLQLQARLKERFGSAERLSFYILREYGLEITSGTVYKILRGTQESALEKCQAIAHALGFQNTDEAFPPKFLTKSGDGKEKGIQEPA